MVHDTRAGVELNLSGGVLGIWNLESFGSLVSDPTIDRAQTLQTEARSAKPGDSSRVVIGAAAFLGCLRPSGTHCASEELLRQYRDPMVRRQTTYYVL
jgi:hypothetical protein